VLCAAALAAAVGGCGATPAPTGAVAATCRQIGAVLGDGPDPSADPVGYAEAQVLPLGQITTSDAGLRQALRALASAYQQFFNTGGGGAAAQAVSRAAAALDAICPGVAS
jgi:hypothetical protein